MRNRVKILERKFYVDTDNKVVVCELKCDMQLAKHPAWQYMDIDMWRRVVPKVKYNGEFTVKATAKCSPHDFFNEKKGKMIAESRAKCKMFNTATKVYALCRQSFNSLSCKCDNSFDACATAYTDELKHLDKLITL